MVAEMAKITTATIIDQHVFENVRWLALHSPEIATGVQAGQYILVRCADPASADPLLRRVLFVADVDRGDGRIGTLYTPEERGYTWLAARRSGERLDVFGPLGMPFTLDHRTRNLLLLGAGPGIGALLLLAREAIARRIAVVLLAAAPSTAMLPPPLLLPAEVEYHSSADGDAAILDMASQAIRGKEEYAIGTAASNQHLARWADQIAASLPDALLPSLASVVRAGRLRWERNFAQVALAGAMPCGTGACQACLTETRHGLRTRCKDGPIFDLRDLLFNQ